jgi:hypothetical protein
MLAVAHMVFFLADEFASLCPGRLARRLSASRADGVAIPGIALASLA